MSSRLIALPFVIFSIASLTLSALISGTNRQARKLFVAGVRGVFVPAAKDGERVSQKLAVLVVGQPELTDDLG
jgi:hypothetical protein